MIPQRIFLRKFSHAFVSTVMKHDFAQSRLFIYKMPVRVLYINRFISRLMLINVNVASALVVVFPL